MHSDNNIDDINKPFHSNGYAQIASGNRIGASSNITFNQRQVVESSRRIIGDYKKSKLGNLRNALKTKPNDEQISIRGVVTSKPSLQAFNSTSKSTNSKPQNYNPYS